MRSVLRWLRLPCVLGESERSPLRSGSRWDLALASLLFAICLAIAVGEGRRAVAGLTSPYDVDQYRDVASAQSMLDGAFPADPAYRGELIWYNPLMPAVVALVSRLTGADVEAAYVQAGPYLNAMAPIAFFAMMLLLFGPWPALIAVASLLFAPPHNETPWATPTYSPWLFAANFSPAFFYTGLILFWHAARRRSAGAWIAAGLGLGIAFMAHTAPALILGLCAVVAALSMRQVPAAANAGSVRAVPAIFIFIAAAIVASVPLLWSILGHYQLRILNPAPNNWYWSDIGLEQLHNLIRNSINPKNVLAAVGLVFVVRQCGHSLGSRLVGAWFVSALGFFVYNLFQQALQFKGLPPLLPNYHSYVYLQNAGHVLVGIGVWGLVSRGFEIARPGHPAAQSAVVAVLVAGFVFAALPRYRNRSDFTGVREHTLQISEKRSTSRLTQQIRLQTPPGAVILATPEDGVHHIAPAGRQVVVLIREFSNPYVDYEIRAAAQRDMLNAFFSHDLEAFDSLAAKYNVTHVLLGSADIARFDSAARKSIPTVEVFRQEDAVLLSYTDR